MPTRKLFNVAAQLLSTGSSNPDPGPEPEPPPGDLAFSTLRAPSQTFDPDSLGPADGTSPLRTWYDIARGTPSAPGFTYMTNAQRPATSRIAQDLAWDEKYNGAVYKERRTYNGVSYPYYTGPNTGSYFLGRGHSGVSYNLINGGLRATGDLKFLDVAAEDAYHVLTTITKNTFGYFALMYGNDPPGRLFFGRFRDANGVLQQHPDNTAVIRAQTQPDGTKKDEITYGNDPASGNGSRTATLTRGEISLEEALMLGAVMRTALGCHVNRDRFSPTFEPVGNRPTVPAYYAKVADRAIVVFESIRSNWRRKLAGNRRDLPLAMMNTLMHPALAEIAAYCDYAKIKYGAAWKTSQEYAQAARAWRLIFASSEMVGNGQADLFSTHYEAVHPVYGTCLIISHQVARYNPSNTKTVGGVNDGEWTGTEACYTHKNDYTGNSYGAIMGMVEEGVDFIPAGFVAKLANTLAATCLGTGNEYSDSGTPTNNPYHVNGGNRIPSLVAPTAWDGTRKSTSGSAVSMLARFNQTHLAAWDASGDIAERLVVEYNKNYGGRSWHGAVTGLLLYHAVKQGRLAI